MVGILFSHQIKNQKGSIVNGSSFSNANDGASIRLEDGLRNLRREDRTIPFLASIATTPFFLFTYTIYSKKFIVNGLFAGALFHGCATNCISLFCKKAFIMTFNSCYW